MPVPTDENQLLTARGGKVSRSSNTPCSKSDIDGKCHWLQVMITLAAVPGGMWHCTNTHLEGANWPCSGVLLAWLMLEGEVFLSAGRCHGYFKSCNSTAGVSTAWQGDSCSSHVLLSKNSPHSLCAAGRLPARMDSVFTDREHA